VEAQISVALEEVAVKVEGVLVGVEGRAYSTAVAD